MLIINVTLPPSSTRQRSSDDETTIPPCIPANVYICMHKLMVPIVACLDSDWSATLSCASTWFILSAIWRHFQCTVHLVYVLYAQVFDRCCHVCHTDMRTCFNDCVTACCILSSSVQSVNALVMIRFHSYLCNSRQNAMYHMHRITGACVFHTSQSHVCRTAAVDLHRVAYQWPTRTTVEGCVMVCSSNQPWCAQCKCFIQSLAELEVQVS